MRRDLAGPVLAVIFAATGIALDVDPVAADDACPKHFKGSIAREADAGQETVDLEGRDVTSTVAVDFGNRKNYTLYVGDFRIPKKSVGSTIEAPVGKTLVTAFVRAEDGKDLHEGQRLRVGRDGVTVVIDSGGGAQAVTTGQRGSARVRELSDDHVCFTFKYHDDFQRFDGTVSASLVPSAF